MAAAEVDGDGFAPLGVEGKGGFVFGVVVGGEELLEGGDEAGVGLDEAFEGLTAGGAEVVVGGAFSDRRMLKERSILPHLLEWRMNGDV